MKDDIVLLAALVLSCALAITAHIAIVFGLFARKMPGKAAISLFVLPLAPVWAMTNKMLVRGGIWIFAVIVYGVAWLLARGG